jgi:hypothetical protein
MKTSNPILEELYAVRAQIMAQYGDDLRCVFERC